MSVSVESIFFPQCGRVESGLGLIVFALANPDLLMQIFFWTGGVLVALGVWLGPQSDNRYSSGYKDNSDAGILTFTLLPGVIFLALGGLLYWLTS